jgi:flagellar hook-length control protein FliK
VPVPQPELAQALASLRSRPDGTHELSVQLHPAELGAVQVTATISNGQLTVTLACAHQAARDAVAAALPALQQQLQGTNFGGVDLGFSAFAQQQGGQSAPQSQQQPGPSATATERVVVEPAVTSTPPRRVLSDSGLDRLL